MPSKPWIFLFRPWSFAATLVPFLIAAGLTTDCADVRWGRWALGLISGVLFQATVNLLNTWGDERSGVDDVPGAIRTTPQVHDGLVSLRAVLVVAVACAFLASALGLALCFFRDGAQVWRFDWTLLIAGLTGLLGATNYTTGIKFKYRGLGVPFVSFLMGPLECFVALALLSPDAWTCFHPLDALSFLVITLPVAALVGVILHGNDMRDIPTDRAAGIVTFASRLGPKRALVYYALCHVLPYVVWMGLLVLLVALARPRPGVVRCLALLAPLLALPLSVKTVRTAIAVYRTDPACPPWRRLERASGAIHLVFNAAYAVFLAAVGGILGDVGP